MIDTNPAGNKIGFVPEERATRGASRYDAVIATLVGLCALCMSGYTAYMQRATVKFAHDLDRTHSELLKRIQAERHR